LLSVLVLVVAIVAGSLVPRHVPRSGFALLIIGAYRWYAEGAFASDIADRQSEGWARQSWWLVVFISAAIFVGMLAVAFLSYRCLTRMRELRSDQAAIAAGGQILKGRKVEWGVDDFI
jgi:uncharacterized membrane protein